MNKLIVLLVWFPLSALAQVKALEKFNQQIKKVITEASPASVFLADYDPKAKVLTNEIFSGVVIRENGLILTAAHVCYPGKTYLVIFPDGTERTATGLGRIQAIDAAIMKINEPGNYPYAPMGWSSSLKPNEPCISIAFPGSFNANIINTPPATPKRQVVRLGYVAEPLTRRGTRIRTTCLMEPGDSGGPVFDLYGRVVGIHSSINQPVTDNMEIPIDLYRKYWAALNQPVDYKSMPSEEDVPVDSLRMREKNFPGIGNLDSAFSSIKTKYSAYALSIKSVNNGKIQNILGTAIAYKGNTYLVTKNSMLGDSIDIRLPDGKIPGFTIVRRDANNDLALIRLNTKVKKAFDWRNLPNDTVVLAAVGTLLLSAEPAGKGVVSAVGTPEFALKNTSSIGHLGTGGMIKDGKLLLAMVQPNSAAAEYLKPNDEIIRIDSIMLNTPQSMVQVLQTHHPGDIVVVTGRRDGQDFSYSITLRQRPTDNPTHVASRFDGGRSIRYDGFSDTFVHDAVIRPEECGGPLIDANGRLIGINMARYSRTSSIATAARGIRKFIETALNQPLYEVH